MIVKCFPVNCAMVVVNVPPYSLGLAPANFCLLKWELPSEECVRTMRLERKIHLLIEMQIIWMSLVTVLCKFLKDVQIVLQSGEITLRENTVMHHITMFRSTMDCIYHGGSIRV
jgi:hypothetical protein